MTSRAVLGAERADARELRQGGADSVYGDRADEALKVYPGDDQQTR